MKRRLPASDAKRTRSYPAHQYTDVERSLCLALVLGAERADGSRDPPLVTIEQLASLPPAPSRAELYRWVKEETNGERVVNTEVNHDHRSLLSLEERSVLVGFLLYRLKHGQVADAAEIIDFASAAFDKSVTPSWVAIWMPKLGFSKHRPAARQLAFEGRGTLAAAIAWVGKNQPVLRAAHDVRRLVAMDQITVWDNGLVTSCYAPIGG